MAILQQGLVEDINNAGQNVAERATVASLAFLRMTISKASEQCVPTESSL